MCGITGFVGRGSRTDLERMTRALAHRGPDDESFAILPDVAVHLGHRRLRVVDLAGGAQPMWNADHSLCVVFNGEIYNHAALRAELEAAGHVFASDHSDTEVLVHGYREWGAGLPERLDGMFAFAVWDATRRCVFLARDRFGEKPLYWAHTTDLFLFASELTGIAAHGRFDASVDPRALRKYLAHGFLPAPNAYFRNTRKLPGGGWLRFDVGTGAVEEGRYWRFAIEPEETGRSEADLAEDLRERLERAVSRRLMADVPLGVFLSGGVDSSGIASLAMERRGAAGLDTFVIGFREPSYDESAHARAMAKRLGTRHHEEILDMDLARDLVPDVLGRLDEPLADPSLIPTYLLCRFARRHVTVALSGDGGDELFGGYDTFAALTPARIYRSLVPPPLHRVLRRLAQRLPQSDRNLSFDFRLRRMLGGLDGPPELWNPVWLAPAPPDDLRDLVGDTDPAETYAEVVAQWHRDPSLSLVDRTLEFYTVFYLQDGILMKTDRASMMNSLEARAVYLDPDVVDSARRLPARYKVHRGRRKRILKAALRSHVPQAVLDRKKKGFGIPLKAWRRRLELATDKAGCLGLDATALAERIARHRAGGDERLLLWAWLVLCHRPAAAVRH